ncbi:DUF2279 domain-containing protein [Portibacter lacus]|uniref:DUF2279 domain-containing protein n=1 Tax=Portibacter lacus TaxID=1099794 RepID=A0AA37ST85_9BACT|nr:DUF2279 domain-containing protein [Portibacter lacus]GLR19204.1 DUF2279 domain-containing protein [Portibacter lacus]
MNIKSKAIRNSVIVVFICFSGQWLFGQSSFIVPSDTLNHKRFNTATIFAASTYSAFSVGLYNVWYRQYDQTSFHFFNDWNEWNNMDKMGHFYTAYFQGVLCYQGAKWTGLSEKKSILTGAILGTLFQSTIEVMDGFSGKWGFSVPDIAYNTAGISAFVAQQWYWKEQRIHFKVSSYNRPYSTQPILSTDGEITNSLEQRADNLFGSSFAARFLKDYNAQTIWASVNIHSFLPEESRFPKWLNLALGTGSENMFGGYENKWEIDQHTFELHLDEFPRYRQFFIGLDVDLTRLPIDNYYWNSLLSILNIFKIPGPAIEINTLGQIKFHIIHF